MMKKNLNPTASNREVEAMIRYALDHTEQLTSQERKTPAMSGWAIMSIRKKWR